MSGMRDSELNWIHGVGKKKPPKPISIPTTFEDDSAQGSSKNTSSRALKRGQGQQKGSSMISSPFTAGGQNKPRNSNGRQRWAPSTFASDAPTSRTKTLGITTRTRNQPQNRDASGSRPLPEPKASASGWGSGHDPIEVPDDDDDDHKAASSPSNSRGGAGPSSSLGREPSPEQQHRRQTLVKPLTRPAERSFPISESSNHIIFDSSDVSDGARQDTGDSQSARRNAGRGAPTRDDSRDELDCLPESGSGLARRNASPTQSFAKHRGKGKAADMGSQRDYRGRDDDYGDEASAGPSTQRGPVTKRMQGKNPYGPTSSASGSQHHANQTPSSTKKATKPMGEAQARFGEGPTSSVANTKISELPLNRLVFGSTEVDPSRSPTLLVHPSGQLNITFFQPRGKVATISLPGGLEVLVGREEPFVRVQPAGSSPAVLQMQEAAHAALGASSYDSRSHHNRIYCFVDPGRAENWKLAAARVRMKKQYSTRYLGGDLDVMHAEADAQVETQDAYRKRPSSPAGGRSAARSSPPSVEESPTSARPRPRPIPTAAAKTRGKGGAQAQQPSHFSQHPQTRSSKAVPTDSWYAKSESKADEGGTHSALARQHGAPPKPPAPPEPDVQLFRFPFEGPGAVMVYKSDVEKLHEAEFLNDTIIEWGLKVILDRVKAKDAELFESIYLFSSFFYKRLTERRDRNHTYGLVRKWTNKVDLFKKRFIIVPINENLHWYLAVIVNPSYAFNPEAIAEAKERLAVSNLPQRSSTRKPRPTAVPSSEDESGPDGERIEAAQGDAMDTAADPPQGSEDVSQRLEGLSVDEGKNGHHPQSDEAMDESRDGHGDESEDLGVPVARPASPSDPSSGPANPTISAKDQRALNALLVVRASPSQPHSAAEPSHASGWRESSSISVSGSSFDPPPVASAKRPAPGSPSSQERPPPKRRVQDSSPAGSAEGKRRIMVGDRRTSASERSVGARAPKSSDDDVVLVGARDAEDQKAEVQQLEAGCQPEDDIQNHGRGRMVGAGPSGAVSSQVSANGARKPVPIQRSQHLDSDDEKDDAEPKASQPSQSSQRRYVETSPQPESSSRAPSEHGRQNGADGEQRKEPGFFPPPPTKPVDPVILDAVSNHTAVLIFDSLQASHKAATTALREYLMREWRERRDNGFDLAANEAALKDLVKHVDVKAPTQPNFCDCGIYLLHYVERFFTDPERFLKDVIPRKDRKDAAWKDEDVGKKRAAWQQKAAEDAAIWEAMQKQLKEDKQASKEAKLEKERKEAAAAAAVAAAAGVEAERPKEGTDGAKEEAAAVERAKAEQGQSEGQAQGGGEDEGEQVLAESSVQRLEVGRESAGGEEQGGDTTTADTQITSVSESDVDS